MLLETKPALLLTRRSPDIDYVKEVQASTFPFKDPPKRIMTPETQRNVCLDVAVDHRIQRLFQPVSKKHRGRSEHVSRIKQRGRSLERSREEVRITAQLAGPAVKGGIAIALQQPRHSHPFEGGIDVVIEDCATLYAFYDVFTTVSCGTLDIRTDISIVDLLPYMSDKIADIGNDKLTESFRVSAQAICDKEPDVLLCAGKIRQLEGSRSNSIKGDARKLENVGIGRTFGSTPKLPATARIRQVDGRLVSIRRVNGFHPSFAMNYHPQASLLRQLQIMIGAEACGVLRGDWENKVWMDTLRRRCQELSKSLSEKPSPKYLSDYQELYFDALHCLKDSAVPLLSDRKLAEEPTGTIYETLASSNLSEKCNDASLILRQMFCLQREHWPKSATFMNETALENVTTKTIEIMQHLIHVAKQGNGMQIANIIQQAANSILQRVTISSKEVDLSKARDDFLELATNIETLLSDLLLRKEEASNASRQDEVPSTMMDNMNLASLS